MQARYASGAHLRSELVGIPCRRLGVAAAAEHVVEDAHLRQPLLVDSRQRDSRARIAALGQAPFAFFLMPPGRPFPARPLEEGIERAFTNAADLAGEISQAVDFIFAEITAENAPHEDIGNLVC